MVRALVLVSLVAISTLAGCRSFHGEAVPPAEVPQGAVNLGPQFLQKETTVELRGRFSNGEFLARIVRVKEDDREIQIKGTLEARDEGGAVVVGGVELVVAPDSEFESETKAPLAIEALPLGAFVRADAVEREGELVLRKLSLRTRREGEEDELQGRLSRWNADRRSGSIGPIAARLVSAAPIVWDVEGEPAPEVSAQRLEAAANEALHPGLARVRRLEDEDWRPPNPLRPTDFLAVAGELQWESEWRNNHDLQDRQERDRLIHNLAAKLELSFDFDPHVAAFFQARGSHGFVHFDQEVDLEEGKRFELGEAFLLLEDLPLPGISLQVGRQDFDDGREWVMDDELDGVRLWLNLEPLVVELSVSTVLFDTTPEEDGIINWLAGVHCQPFEGLELFGYVLHREDGSRIDLDRTHYGASGALRIGDFRSWFDGGGVTGQEGDLEIDGYGFDGLAGYRIESLPLEPSIYFGLAYGSGDRDPFDGKDRRFRQSGLNDNSSRVFGVTSFRYLGELVRPDLNNLVVLTAGIGFRLSPLTSVDLVWHHYRQEYALAAIGDSRLRLTPTGVDKDLGTGFDLVFAWKDERPLEAKIVFGYFQPGPGFGPEADDAWYTTFEVEWSF